jgi:hypothetical protein
MLQCEAQMASDTPKPKTTTRSEIALAILFMSPCLGSDMAKVTTLGAFLVA